MNSVLNWTNEEEGVLSVFEDGQEKLRCFVYVISQEEAEVKIQDVGLASDIQKNDINRQKIICKMTNALKDAFLTLEEEGFEEVFLIEKRESELCKILGSTNVVQNVFSEYMMKSPKKPESDTRSCVFLPGFLIPQKEEGGLRIENKEKTFFARLSPYRDGWYLYEVEVAEQERNKGVGTACIQGLRDGILQLYLQVGSYNKPAVHIYEKLGFQVVEELCYFAPVAEWDETEQ